MLRFTAQEGEPGVQLLRVTLRRVGKLAPSAVRVHEQFLEVGELCDKAGRKDGEGLLRKAWVPFGRVDQLPAGTVGELDLCRNTVGERKRTCHRANRLGAD